MKIGIDGSIFVFVGSGVANYSFNLVKNLLLIDKKNEYRIFYSSLRRPKNFYYLDELKKLGAKIYDYPFPPTLLRLWWGNCHLLPIEWFIGKVDFFFSSDFLRPPTNKRTKGITTIHDLTWKIFPQFHEDWIIKAHEKKLAKTIKYEDEIIVDSLNTKKDLIKYYPEIDNKRINVLYPGIGKEFKIVDDKERIINILKKYNISFPSPQSPIPNPFLLYVGAIEPRKNLIRSIEVFNELIKDEKFANFNFIIAGRAGWRKENIFQKVNELKLQDKVRFIGFVEDEDLPYLYSAAKLTVYLSAYEGFGLPPLESLACGTKVIAGDNSSIKETIDKEFLVDISDKNKILEKMKYLLSNKIKINAKEVQDKFNWKNSAKKFLEIISSI